MCLPFAHDYGAPLEFQAVDLYSDLSPSDIPEKTITRIVFVCSSCGKVKVKKVNGRLSERTVSKIRV